ncbi:MAG: T9SS type A sorting domain-containing protein, partial [Imperialibacter sp.]
TEPSYNYVPGQSEADIEIMPTFSIAANELSSPGQYPIIFDPGYDENYTFWYASPSAHYFTITKAPLIVTPVDVTKVYGEPMPPLTMTYSGFIGNDDESVLDLIPTAYTNANQYSYASSQPYPIFLYVGFDNNYDVITYMTGNLTVVKADQIIDFDGFDCLFHHRTPIVTVSSGMPLSFTMQDPSSIAYFYPQGGHVEFLQAGTVAVTAGQEGNQNYNPAISVTREVTWYGNQNIGIITVSGGLSSVGYADLSAGPGYDYNWNGWGYGQTIRVYSPGYYQVNYMSPGGCQYLQANVNIDYNYNYGRIIDESAIEEAPLQEELVNQLDFGLYPNPANHEVLIALSEESVEDHPLIVSDLSGKVIMELTFKEGEKQKTISLETLISGVYLVHVVDNGKMHYKKLIVKRE